MTHALPSLLLVSGSKVALTGNSTSTTSSLAAVALLQICPATATVAVASIVTALRALRLPRLHRTAVVHVGIGVTDTPVRPAGTGSRRTTPLATLGPLFVTSIRKVTGSPTLTSVFDTDFFS